MSLAPPVVLAAALAYVGLLFAVAFFGDARAARGRSLIASPNVYALSIAVYCTSWTFYGSVGLAASGSLSFLTIYLGPTLMALLFPSILARCLTIAKRERITTIADFIGARYGKSAGLAALVAFICVVGVVPYIALQLKAVAASFDLITGGGGTARGTALGVALAMAAFAIVFGARRLDASERHEGLVAAIAFESIIKLLAFLAVGMFVTFTLFDGPAELFARAAADGRLEKLWQFDGAIGTPLSWTMLTLLSMSAILLLPRQFQVAVVENVDPQHVRRAVWLLPLYLLAINLFVLPIACAGVLLVGGGAPADMYVLALPLGADAGALALFVFLGGLSAATGMIIVETTALATMISNDLVLPILLRRTRALPLSTLLLWVRRAAMVAVVLLGYLYFRFAAEARALVSIGLISFAAVAQLAPAFFGGLYWREATRAGAYAGLACGFLVWAYTLLLPSLAQSGWLAQDWLTAGPAGIAALRPHALFGLDGLDPVTHGAFWSLAANLFAYVGVSLFTRPGARETRQAALFVDEAGDAQRLRWYGGAATEDLRALLTRILGPAVAQQALAGHADGEASAALLQKVESLLAGAIGSASARILVASIAKEAPLGMEEVMSILDETSQAIHVSRELAARTAELREANLRLQELDRMKDDFMSTVTHELRTPLTSIRAFSEILHENPALPESERQRFLGIVIKETERLTRLINDVLDLARLDQDDGAWPAQPVGVAQALADAQAATAQLFHDAGVKLSLPAVDPRIKVRADPDRLQQVLLNLLGNAVKFAPRDAGRVELSVMESDDRLRISVRDNGPGVRDADRAMIFEKFRQSGDTLTGKPRGTGLGLPICKRIVERMGGRIWLADTPLPGALPGAMFCFELPLENAA